MTLQVFALLVGAGFAAGLSGTIAGLASLFSYPALLAAGLSPVSANVTNTISLAIGSIGAVHSSREELTGQGRTLLRLAVICASGSAAGAALVLVSPPGVFEKVVPFLVGGASVLILVRRRTSGDENIAAGHRHGWLASAGVFGVSVYSGYFAAAAGVMVFAVLLASMRETLLRTNALKNVLMVVADVVAAAGFALFGPVDWTLVLPLSIGLLAGSWLGPVVARRLPTGVLRIGIALAGVGLAIKLGLDAF
ncbi:sulfite exporter TauE/SafE family protein [Amycolatopsis keratiniphila]|uniref:Probable membrane transporter protein n=1 Tax=Amycolatopsis keratiniphila subsp. keratiniphila TaxID=227715 RepID=A0A1W2M1M6_9PSEU|nr:sulfite exporter TauE/SafE family protein [Amycolatopsis keratiniphila]ONF73764.1 transporter [Amycolatopsis keratiniphila subsp. keratiniphila]